MKPNVEKAFGFIFYIAAVRLHCCYLVEFACFKIDQRLYINPSM